MKKVKKFCECHLTNMRMLSVMFMEYSDMIPSKVKVEGVEYRINGAFWKLTKDIFHLF
jgi:hypothetical protein